MIKYFLSLQMMLMFFFAAAQNNTPSNSELAKDSAKIYSGFFKIYQMEDKYYFEIPDSLLGRDILVVNRVVRSVINSGYYPGDQIGQDGLEKLIRFEKGDGNKIVLYNISYAIHPPEPGSPMYDAVTNSTLQKVAAVFDIKGLSKGSKGYVIDMTDQVMGGGALANGSATVINLIKAYASNIEIRAVRSVEASVPQPGASPAEPAAGGTMEMNSSLLLLPKIPMQARYFDERVGYFNTSYNEFNEKGIKNITLICRRRLEPKAKDMEKYKRGELVEPEKPIIIYIDAATPKKWVPYLIQGINDWQAVLERAGFKNAIYGRLAPTKEEDSTWSMEDARNSVIVYKASPIDNAQGPHIHDPRSGEIIESHINWHHNIMKRAHDWYMIEAGPIDTRARKMIFDDELMGSLIRVIACHEVGHALGLRHNLGASSTVPVEKLRDKAWLKANGHTPSIMDYARFNYVAQPEDSVGEEGIFPRIGNYDKWAIEWGYRLFPQYKSPGEELTYINAWTREHLKDSTLWWGDGEGANRNDPRSQAEDLGDNAMKAGAYGIKNLQRVIKGLRQWTKQPNTDFDDLANMYHEVVGVGQMGAPSGQLILYINNVLQNIGGVYKTPRVVEDAAPVYVPVSKSRQQEAVHFLNEQLFETPYWLIDSSVLNRTGDNPLSIINMLQSSTLTLIFSKNLRNLFSALAFNKDAYSPNELLNDLEKGIWGELATHKSIDIFRRNLQKNYIITLSNAFNSPQDLSDLPALARAHLIMLQKQIASALLTTTDSETRYHLQDVLKRIEKALTA